MPGRGQPWKKGGLVDETVKEEDLSLALQAKVNSVGGGHAIQDEGTPLIQRANLNFKGTGVVASDGIEDTTDITIAGGSLSREEVGSPNDDFYIYDEFFYPTFGDIDHLEHVENSGQIPNPNVGGVIQQTTSTVLNNDTRLNTCGAGLATVDGTKKLILRWRAKLTVADINTAFICGLTKPNDGPQAPFPYGTKPGPIISFFFNGVGNIFTYSATSGVSNIETSDTGVAMDTSFHTYEIEFDPAGTPTITYKIDGVIVVTQTANIPTGNLVCWIGVQNGTTASRAIQVDSWFLFNER